MGVNYRYSRYYASANGTAHRATRTVHGRYTIYIHQIKLLDNIFYVLKYFDFNYKISIATDVLKAEGKHNIMLIL